VLRTLSLCTCCRHYPGAAAGRSLALPPSHISLPRYPCRVGLHVGFFEACSAFTHVAACTRARSPSRDRYPEASDISSPPCLLRLLPAGADAGWDLHPLESAALHGARDTQPPIPTFANGSYLRRDWPHLLVSASTLWRVNSTSVSRHQRALWNGAWCDPRCFGGFDSVETSLYASMTRPSFPTPRGLTNAIRVSAHRADRSRNQRDVGLGAI